MLKERSESCGSRIVVVDFILWGTMSAELLQQSDIFSGLMIHLVTDWPGTVEVAQVLPIRAKLLDALLDHPLHFCSTTCSICFFPHFHCTALNKSCVMVW